MIVALPATAAEAGTGDEAEVLATVAVALAAGLVVGLPTDTVYGLAVAPFVAGAVDRVFAAKQRPRDVRLPVLVAGVAQVEMLAGDVPGPARRLMDAFWPGALTVVVNLDPRVEVDLGDIGSGTGRPTVGVRSPALRFVRELCAAAGPLAVTSANHHGEPECGTAAEVQDRFGDAVALVLDGGPCRGAPSTVVDCTGPRPVELRPGAVPWAEVLAAL